MLFSMGLLDSYVGTREVQLFVKLSKQFSEQCQSRQTIIIVTESVNTVCEFISENFSSLHTITKLRQADEHQSVGQYVQTG